MSTSNKNFLVKQNRLRDIVNSLITSNTNYKYRLTRPRYNTLILLNSSTLLPSQGFGPEAKTRGGIIVSPAYTYKECVNIGVVCL